MPEMPEVETIARKLRKSLIGKVVAGVHLSGLPLRKPIADSFACSLEGRTVHKIHRRGKYIIVEMEPALFWVIHLGMSGRVFYFKTESETPKHTHATIRFTDRTELQYRDHRRFGLLATYQERRLDRIPGLDSLGREPLSSSLTSEWLGRQLRASRQEIKAFLLDQSKIAGLGNIYVCEALYHSRIHPQRRCNTLTEKEAGALVKAIRKVIRLAVFNRGTSFSDFMDSDGEFGDNQNFLSVFQLEGERCGRCRSRILRLRQGNRSSFYCPRCQH